MMGYFGSRMFVIGHFWICMDIYGCLCISLWIIQMIFCLEPTKHMDIHGYLWFTDMGYLWDLLTFLWRFVGFSWVATNIITSLSPGTWTCWQFEVRSGPFAMVIRWLLNARKKLLFGAAGWGISHGKWNMDGTWSISTVDSLLKMVISPLAKNQRI